MVFILNLWMRCTVWYDENDLHIWICYILITSQYIFDMTITCIYFILVSPYTSYTPYLYFLIIIIITIYHHNKYIDPPNKYHHHHSECIIYYYYCRMVTPLLCGPVGRVTKRSYVLYWSTKRMWEHMIR
jgi:hypothetical protein